MRAPNWFLAIILCLNQAKAQGVETAFEYKEDLTRHVAMVHGRQFYLGTLDSLGNFVPSAFEQPYTVGQPFNGPSFDYINLPCKPNEVVFEFRSGILIKGELCANGSFVPKIGEPMTSFKDYKFSNTAPRIYNLPGRFVPKNSK